ncbi:MULTISPECIES: phospholipase D family protein [unclassified Acinetobacter]|uniref:phospholipase D family protein n=1 Tax=unclassified Acinetobacter TaxID=196816 RepID=UPI00293494E6|nr:MULTISPECIES: phospholipase D family protein [unclassified Acinetobacter]WOE32263.1 phospholipase D family protein [Acinetobacter sp. SAAs470]WOE37733.1 phospholipase D family protein [Acinetobacter sp. SAAs474]
MKRPKNITHLTDNDATYWIHEKNFKVELSKGLTAFLPLNDAFLSIASRRHIINNAKFTIDLQYYIWKNDSIGQLLLSDLLKAADRGVKIRLLIDDQNGTQLDSTLKLLALHPNFNIKIFNPYKFRKLRLLDYIFRFKHINHRMHNKLIIGDNKIAVTGGRNISREYFDAGGEFQFADLDVLFFGPATSQANNVFQQFWQDSLSYCITELIKIGTAEDFQQLKYRYELDHLRLTQFEKQLEHAEYIIREKLQHSPIRWAKAHFIADTPNKIRGKAKIEELISTQMLSIIGKPKKSIELVSAYFVPRQNGLEYLVGLRKQNTHVRILTNSYLANDVPVVHAFYQKYRKKLLAAGVKLYEFKPYIERKKRTWYEVATGNVIPAKGKNASRLHAKFFDIDGIVFIGSFNFDPRSVRLNTEVGLVIESNILQDQISNTLNDQLHKVAYELKLNDKGKLFWLDHKENGTIIYHTKEPQTTKFQRFAIRCVSFLPIEWMM